VNDATRADPHGAGAPRPIVFDLGGVVVEWLPERLLEKMVSDASVRARVRQDVLGHDDWLALDRGTLEADEAVRRFAARTNLDRALIAGLFDAVAPSLVPKEDTLALMRELRAAGHPLYYLSNMAHAWFDYIERHRDFWPLFEGGVVSCRVGLLKPEPAIFEHLLAQYGLSASDTIFVDDIAENVAAAAALGISALRFTDAHECARELRALTGLGLRG
jgi:putative hydrolase of the HAD superfamily